VENGGRLLYLSRSCVRELAPGIDLFVDSVHRALSLHARGATAQPLKPYLRPAGAGAHIADRIIAMPGAISGDTPAVGLKWVSSKHDNPAVRQVPRASALIVLNDPESYRPVAVIEGTEISAMRTAAVTVLATRHLARTEFTTVGLVGCGVIGRAHVNAMNEQFDSVERFVVYDERPDAARMLAERCGVEWPRVRYDVANTARGAVEGADVVITATITDTPYIEFNWLAEGAFVSNVSIMDVEKDAYLHVDKLIVDDWDQSNREGKIIHQLVQEGRLSRADLHAELGDILIGARPGRTTPDERILLNPMGMAIEDVACAAAIYERAIDAGAGVWLDLE
jgi:ornithine cyclodeaminase